MTIEHFVIIFNFSFSNKPCYRNFCKQFLVRQILCFRKLSSMIRSLCFCFVILDQALVKRFALVMNAITKFFAGLWITITWTSISAFNQGIARSNVIQKMVYNNYCSHHRKNTPEKQERKFVAQRFFSC